LVWPWVSWVESGMMELSTAIVGRGRRASLFYGLILAVYAVITCITLCHHELWRDEALTWVVARDAGFFELFRVAALEGHPSLWYLLLMPFAKFGMPCFTMLLIHWSLAVAAVAVFLWCAPFPKITKVLFVFSYYMFWEYCLSIRFYTLGILLIFSLTALHRDRFRFPILYATLLVLLLNTSIPVMFIAIALFLVYVWDYIALNDKRPRVKLAIVLMVLGIIAAYLQIGKFPGSIIQESFSWKTASANELTAVVQAFFVSDPRGVLVLAGFAILALVGYVLVTKPASLLILGIHLAGNFGIFLFLTGGTRHHGLILIGILVSLWLAAYYPDSELSIFRSIRTHLPDFNQRWHTCMVALNLSLLMALPIGVSMHRLDLKYQYSGSKKMAQFIRANYLDRYPIAAWRDAQTFPVLVYLPGKQFWCAGLKKYGTYYRQTKERGWAAAHVTYGDALQNIERAFPENEPVLILLDVPLDTQQMPRYKLLFKVDGDIFFAGDERLYLYLRVAPGTVPQPADANRSLPGPPLPLPQTSASK